MSMILIKFENLLLNNDKSGDIELISFTVRYEDLSSSNKNQDEEIL